MDSNNDHEIQISILKAFEKLSIVLHDKNIRRFLRFHEIKMRTYPKYLQLTNKLFYSSRMLISL